MGKVMLQYALDFDEGSTWITVTPSVSARQGLIYVQELGDFPAREHYFTRREGLDSFLIKYVLSGKGYLSYGGQDYEVTPGSIMWIDCEHPQSYGTSPDTGRWHILWVHFTGANSRWYYEQFLRLNNGSVVAELAPGNCVATSIRQLLSLYEQGATAASDVRASAILTGIMADCIERKRADAASMPECVHRARIYLSEHYASKITLDDLSQRYAMDKYYFQKLFKRCIGLSPNEYLLIVRLTRAKELLRETPKSIREVALEVGVGNPSYFINLFKQHEHMTPNTYRNNWYTQDKESPFEAPARQDKQGSSANTPYRCDP
ncbi:MAG: AraC family transcriptional regulator [Clostridia bacterium]